MFMTMMSDNMHRLKCNRENKDPYENNCYILSILYQFPDELFLQEGQIPLIITSVSSSVYPSGS